MPTDRERFLACMEYASADRRPNHELGVWPQTRKRWMSEDPAACALLTWDWFSGVDALDLDRSEYIPVDFGFLPPFERVVIEETEEYEVVRNEIGVTTRALKAGTVDGGRTCMDQYLDFPVKTVDDFHAIKRRLIAALPARYPADLAARIERWNACTCPVILGTNCAANGFYWRAREWMGTEALSYAWYDQPALLHEMMEFFADFVVETARPVLERIRVDYFTLNEDMSMRSGPLLSPATFRTFILPHLRRMVAFFRDHGTRYFAVDTDGDPSALIPLLMDAGVDTLWPLERAAGINPVTLRQRFGRGLRLWGGVDKRVLPCGEAAVKEHLRSLIPLIEEGGFIPTVDHTVPPDVSWDDFRRYMDAKRALLAGDYGKLE